MNTATFNKEFDRIARQTPTQQAYDFEAGQDRIVLTYNGLTFFENEIPSTAARSVVYQVALKAMEYFAGLTTPGTQREIISPDKLESKE